ncbi:hypothetical protein ACCT26_12620 [Rhizobium ruizarguesonis]
MTIHTAIPRNGEVLHPIVAIAGPYVRRLAAAFGASQRLGNN